MHFSLHQWISVSLGLTRVAAMGAILFIGLKKKRAVTIPYFLELCCVLRPLARYVGLAGVPPSPCIQYSYLLWDKSFPCLTVLEFGVMYEVCVRNAVKPYSALIDLGKNVIQLGQWLFSSCRRNYCLAFVDRTGGQSSKICCSIAVSGAKCPLNAVRLADAVRFCLKRSLGLLLEDSRHVRRNWLRNPAVSHLAMSYLRSAFSA